MMCALLCVPPASVIQEFTFTHIGQHEESGSYGSAPSLCCRASLAFCRALGIFVGIVRVPLKPPCLVDARPPSAIVDHGNLNPQTSDGRIHMRVVLA